LLTRGSDPISVAALLGHVDGTMLCKNYEHISTDAEHLHTQLKKGVTAPATTNPATTTNVRLGERSTRTSKRAQKVA
jgi:hypothetical protein